MSQPIFIGIDFGTNFIKCSFYNSTTRNVEVLKFLNRQELPACISFNHLPIVIGVPAYNAIGEVKRIIGLKYNNSVIQEEIENGYFPFEIVEDEDGFCKIQIPSNSTNQQIEMKPEEIVAIIFRHIKNEILRSLVLPNDTPIEAVVTVPIHFTDEQKNKTMKAVQIAGMKLISFVSDVSAAMMVYKEERRLQNGYYLSLNFGASTFDLTFVLVEQNGNKVKCIANAGDSHLGGLDFDKNLTEKILENWEEEDPENNLVHLFRISAKDTHSMREQKKRRIFKLRKMAEKAKIELSTHKLTEIDMSEFSDENFILTISREDFEECNNSLFERIIKIVREQLTKKGINKKMLKGVVLIGGSSQIPKFQQMIKEEFPEVQIMNEIDSNIVIAKGAGLLAKEKCENPIKEVSTVTTRAVYIKRNEDLYELIPLGTELPHHHEFFVEGNNKEVYLELFEVESGPNNERNQKSLGIYAIKNIPKEDAYIQCSVIIDENGLMKLEATLSNGEKVICENQLERGVQNENVSQDILDSQALIQRFFEI